MIRQFQQSRNRLPSRWSAWLLFAQMLAPFAVLAQGASFTNLLTQADELARTGDVKSALTTYAQAETTEFQSASNVCLITHRICDLMYQTQSADLQKSLADHALSSAKLAVQIDSKNALAHVCLGIAYAKNFPFVDAHTKIRYSRQIKMESEQAIALDPKQDLGYYLLGRWNHGVADMSLVERGVVKIVYGGLPKASNQAAIENLKTAAELSPKRIITHAELAKIYRETGQKELANREWKTCQSLAPMDRDDRDAQADAIKELKKRE